MTGSNDYFSRACDRRHTHSIKWDLAGKQGYPPDTLPLWVADMDFAAPPQVRDALESVAGRGLWGYTFAPDSYYEAVCAWMDRRHGWSIQPDWLTITPGVIAALNCAIKTWSEPGDSILILEPVYHPFRIQIEQLGRRAVSADLNEQNLHYTLNFAEIEQKIISEQIRLLIFCSPHNPVGRVWTRTELERLAEICLRHDVLIVADEIHHDLILPGHRHQVLASLSDEIAARTVTCTAPSKTFNLAGMATSNIVISDAKLREEFKQTVKLAAFGPLSPFSLTACETAYRTGDQWLDQLLEHLAGQDELLRRTCAANCPPIEIAPLQGTYLAWLDCRRLGLDAAALNQFFLEKAHLWLNNGLDFGRTGEGFMRLNLACTRELLEEALQRLASALNGTDRPV